MMWAMLAAMVACGGEPVTNCINLPTYSQRVTEGTSNEVSLGMSGRTLSGTLTDGDANAPAVLLIPGSGPTDRNGDNPLGVKGGIYRQLTDLLKKRGVATLRADKRGVGESKVDGDPNAVTIADYVEDNSQWMTLLMAQGHRCVWLAGHSEGGLIALTMAAEHPEDLCGVILIAAPGRRMDAILKSQLKPKLPADMWAPTEAAIDRLAKGEKVDPATAPVPLQSLFAPQVQGFLIDMMKRDPTALAARIKLPMLIIQGEEDAQVSVEDAKALKASQPQAALVLLDGTNHVLKTVPKGDAAANLATYGNADLPIDPRVANAIANFIGLKR